MTSTLALEHGVFIHPHALVETECVGQDTRIWAFAHVMNGSHIGAGCNICDHVFIESGVTIGNGVTVKNGVAIWNSVTVEDRVFLGPNCVLTNDRNPRASIRKGNEQLIATRISEDATIGANATIVCGVTIGKGAFVGAGAVVLRSIPSYALVVGNPAQQIGWMCLCANRLRTPVRVDHDCSIRCDACGRMFDAGSEGLVLAINDGMGAPAKNVEA